MATSVPVPDNPKDEASWLREQNNCGRGDSHRWCTQAKGVCALRVSQAGSRILKVGGKIFIFNLLAMESPRGGGTMLLSGPQKGQEVYQHFDKAPGTPHNHTNHT